MRVWGDALVSDREGLEGGAGGVRRPALSPLPPTPDLTLVLPFSSPCLLQAPCLFVEAVRSTVLAVAPRASAARDQ